MKRTLLAGSIAVAFLFGGSVLLLLLVSGDAGSSTPAPPPQSLGEDALPPRALPPAAVAPPPPSRAAPEAPVKLRASSWNAPAADPAAAPMASRVVRMTVRKALLAASVQARLARCADATGGYGGAAAPGPLALRKPAVLALELEASGGQVRVVDAQAQQWGGASAAAVSCARNVLVGHVVSAPRLREERGPAEPPARSRMPFPLNPRTDAVASSR